jgi:hypothetical protein
MGAEAPSIAGYNTGLLGRAGASALSGGTLQGGDTLARTGDLSNAVADAKRAALFGGGVTLGGGALGSAVSAWGPPAVQRLIGRNVPLTTGQTVPGLATVEHTSESLPIGGLFTTAARKNAEAGLNRATANEALSPIGQSLNYDTPAGREAMAEVNKRVDRAYTRATSGLYSRIDGQLDTDIAATRAGLAPRIQGDFDGEVQRLLRDRADSTGTLSGANMKKADMDLRDKATSLIRNGDSWDTDLGKALNEVRDHFHSMWTRYNTPNAIQALRNTDDAYARARIMEQAGNYVGAPHGVFNADQLYSAATSQGIRYQGKRAFGEGQARMQAFAEDAKDVMGGKRGNSGTAERSSLIGAVGALGGLIGGGHMVGQLPAALGAAGASVGAPALFNAPPVKWAVRGLAAGYPQTRNDAAALTRFLTTGPIANSFNRNPNSQHSDAMIQALGGQ